MKTGGLIVASLALVVSFCGAMLLMTLATLQQLDRAEVDVAMLDKAKHAAHMAEAQLREQYIHQAHCIIERDLSHVPHYRATVATTRAAIDRLSRLVRQASDRSKVRTLANLAAKNDLQFRTRIVPALKSASHAVLVDLHRKVVPIVAQVTRINAQLSHTLNQRSAAARKNANSLRRRTRTMAIACFGSAFVVAVLVGGFLTRRIGGRVAQLRGGAQRIAAGELDARVELTGRDEFAELAQAFNQMSTDLASHQAGLLRAQRLASIGQVAAGVAHEINNPLAVILGYAKMLQQKVTEPHAEKLAIIADEARQCQRIVEDLLMLARQQQLSRATFDLAATCRDEIERLQETGKLQRDRASVHAPESGVAVHADEGRLRQVLANLLINAAEASEQGAITVSIRRNQTHAQVGVKDHGPGMNDEQREKATEPFYTTKATGVGMGLAISQALVEAHGGSISIRSNDDQGVTVCIDIPAGEA